MEKSGEWTDQQQRKVRVAGVLCPLLLFADDIVLASTNPKLTQRLLSCLSDWCSLSGLEVNVGKTVTLVGGVVPNPAKANKRYARHDYRLYYRGTEVPIV